MSYQDRQTSRRRLLGVATVAAFLTACRNGNQPAAPQRPSRAELERDGIITPVPTRTPNPALGNRRVGESGFRVDQRNLPLQWDVTDRSPSGALVLVKYATSAEPGAINIVTPLDVIRRQRVVAGSTVIENNGELNYSLADLNGSQLHANLNINREIPKLADTQGILIDNWDQIEQRHILVGIPYDSGGFIGKILVGYGDI